MSVDVVLSIAVGVGAGASVGAAVAVLVGAELGVLVGVEIGVGVGSSEHPARRMARSAAANDQQTYCGLIHEITLSFAFQALRSGDASCIFDDGSFRSPL